MQNIAKTNDHAENLERDALRNFWVQESVPSIRPRRTCRQLKAIIYGIVMLALPGQGVLTVLIGISLTNFPGKYALERKLVSQPSVFNAINWLRKRSGKPPLAHPQFDAS